MTPFTLMPTLALSFDRLHVATPTDAPKRKAVGHYGMNVDSSLSVILVALSRLLRTREVEVLEQASRSSTGAMLLTALRSAVLRVALATGTADPALTEANITTFFNLSASTIANQRLYNGGLSLPTRLPWRSAKSLLLALLESLSAAATTVLGSSVARALTTSLPLTVDDHAQMAALVSQVEAGTVTRIGDSCSSRSSNASGRSTPPPQSLPSPLPMPIERAFVLDATQSLLDNAQRLVQARMRRTLTDSEHTTLIQALEEGLSVLQAGGVDTRRELLQSNVLLALGRPPAAQLWACALETAEGELQSVAVLANAIIDACSNVAAMLFASALGI
jgi:hypothetical protein